MLFTIAHEVGHLVARHDRRDASYAMLDSSKDFDGFVSSPQKAEESLVVNMKFGEKWFKAKDSYAEELKSVNKQPVLDFLFK